MATHAPQTDKRLLGTWQSDRCRTVPQWHFTKRLTPQRRRWFFAILGKLRVTYTRTRIRSTFNDSRCTQRYEVLGSDSDSVAIRYEDTQVTGQWCIEHIHFEGRNRYWISLGHNREWFRRVRKSKG